MNYKKLPPLWCHCLQARLSSILQFYANYKAAENRPNACFWPVAAVTNNGSGLLGAASAAAACNLSAAAAPADYFHDKNTAVQVGHLA